MANKQFFNLKAQSGWTAKSDKGWCQFLNDNGVWPPNVKGGSSIDNTFSFSVPAKAYYNVNGSFDDYGTVYINGNQVLSIKDYKAVYNSVVLLEAGNHTIRITGKDNKGNQGVAITVEGDVDAQVAAQQQADAAAKTQADAKKDLDAKNAAVVSAEAAAATKVTTDVKITYNNGPVSASASASGSASAQAGAEAHAGVDGNYASAGASASASAGVEASAGASGSVGNNTASIGASVDASAYANASASASAEAGAGLQGNNAVAGGSVEIVIRTEAGVSAQAQADATLLGIQLAEAQAQGSASTYTEVYVRADGSVKVGQDGVEVQAGAIAGYGIGAGASGSAGVTTAVGGASVDGGAEVSIGAQIGAEGEAHATLKGDKLSIGINGEAAILVGLDADVNVDLDFGPTVDAVNAALKSGKTINEALTVATTNFNQTAAKYNKEVDQALKLAQDAAKAAEKVYNDAVKGATDAANQAANVTNSAIKTTEKALNDAGKTITNGVVDLGNQAVKGVNDAGKAITDTANSVSKGAEDAWNSTKKLFSDIRVKENIQLAGQVEGINVYTYNYVWDKTLQKGVMAQELLGTRWESAVSVHDSGYYQVDYEQLPAIH